MKRIKSSRNPRYFFVSCSTILDTCKDFAHDVRLAKIRKSEGRSPYPKEIVLWKPDEDFWQEMFQDVWETMQEEVTPSELLRAFYYFVKNEHQNMLDKPQTFSRMKTVIAKYIQDLYEQNDSKKMIKFMQEQEQVKERTVPVADKKVYFTEITEYLTRNIMSPWSNFPHSDEWKQRFEGVKKQLVTYLMMDILFEELITLGFPIHRAIFLIFLKPKKDLVAVKKIQEKLAC